MVAGKLDLQKRQHRERAQPLKRQRLGLLEKHADYVLRARDFHSKQDRLKKLKEKASGKNADEFYFSMLSSRTSKGIHVQSRGNEPLPQDLVKVLKSQDAGYIRNQRAIEDAKVTRLSQRINSLVETGTDGLAAPQDDDDDMYLDDYPSTSTAPARSHVVFSDSLIKVQTAPDAKSLLPKKKVLPLVAIKKLSKSLKGKGKAAPIDESALAAETLEAERVAKKHRATLTTELEARKTRLSALTRALRELELQRLLMGRGAKQALVPKKSAAPPGDTDDPRDLPEAETGIASGARVWKWKSERKR